jgi:hypothetical protein
MQRRSFLAMSLLAGLGSATYGCSAVAKPGTTSYRYIDATARLADAAGRDPVWFREHVIARYRDVYRLIDPLDDTSITDLLTEVRANPAALARVRDEFPAAFAEAWRRFARLLSLDEEPVLIYILPAHRDALGGSVRSIGRRDYVILGSDVMGLLLDSRVGLETFVQHELTHLHHQQANEEIRRVAREFFARADGSSTRLYHMMWLEGFAAHVSQALNPRAGSFEVFLNRNMREQMTSSWSACIAKLTEHFDSRDTEAIARYVFSGDAAEMIPGRTGYYVGSLIAAHLARDRTLSDLSALDGARLRTAVWEGLQSIARSGPQATSASDSAGRP